MGQSSGGRAGAPGGKGGSVFDQSANAFGQAGTATRRAGLGFQDIASDPTGGIGHPGFGYRANQQNDPARIKAGMSGYMNPFINDVVRRTQGDIGRQTDLGLRTLGDSAAGAGAFGGSRHGIAEGTAIGEGARASGDISAELRARGFDTAAGLAGQDVANRMGVAGGNQAAINRAREFGAGGRSSAAEQAAANRLAALSGLQSTGAQGATLAGQGLQMGQGMLDRQAADGATVRGINQDLITQGAGMFDRYAGQPMESTAAILNLLAGNPLNAAKTQTGTATPGTKSMLKDALGMGTTAARVF